jgi:uncharacterized membrane protein (DUF485 family)
MTGTILFDDREIAVGLRRVSARRSGLRLVLTLMMIGIYFGFMVLFAFDKPLLGRTIAPGLTLCILLGPIVIISGCVLSLIYVSWSQRVFDRHERETRP